jgi:DnaK suppressor protein
MYHVKEELQDVLLPFQKSKTEHTAFAKKQIRLPFRLQRWLLLPTARQRTIFLYHVQFEKKTLPIWAERMKRSGRCIITVSGKRGG